MDFSRLKAKPWKQPNTSTHGRYKDIFNLNQLSPRDGQRNTHLSPDMDYNVDGRNKNDDLPMTLAEIERKSTKIGREELKKVIMKQRITLEKNTRLYKEMRK